MNASSKSRLSPLILRLALISAVVLSCLAVWRLWSFRTSWSDNPYTYIDGDYPETWDIGNIDQVKMYIHDTIHYELDTEAGDADFEQLFPPGGHTVYLGPDRRPFTVAMFHQLRCLDIIRRDFIHIDEKPLSDLGSHCINYVYQTVLCHSNTRLESIHTHDWEKSAASWEQDYVCQDWEAAYAAAAKNHQEYLQANATM